jgi:MoxR-like ATPase
MPKKLIAKDTDVLDTPLTLVVASAAPAAMNFTALASVTAQLRALRDQAAAQFVARAEMAEAVAVALAANEHVFVYGPPGTAKSSLLRTFASGIGGKFFRIVLNPDITREDVVGPLDPAAVRNGEWRRKWSKFATSEIAFLDEVWKASPQVANMLLDGLEERLVTDGDDDLPIPLISAVAASNEVPDDKALRAAYDRFLVRLSLDYIHDPDDFRALLTSVGTAPVAPLLTADDLRTIGKEAEHLALNPPPEVTEQLVELWRQIGVGRISDRRWKKTLKLAMAYALLCDEPPAPRHLGVARWTLWSEPDEETSIRNTVLALTDPAASDVLDCEALLADLKMKAGTLQGAKLQERAEIAGKARKLVAKSQKLAASSDAKAYAPRLTAVANEATAIVNQVVDLMTGGGA